MGGGGHASTFAVWASADKSFSPLLPRQFLDRRLYRRRRVIVAFPRLRFGEQRRHGADRVAFGIEVAAHLRPSQRHRNGGAFARPRREYRDRGRHTIVAHIIEENLSLALLLRHVEQIALGVFIGHPLANTLRESFCFLPRHLVFCAVSKRRHHVKPLAAGSLAETLNTDVCKMLPHVLGGLDDVGKFDLRRGVEIEHQPPGYVRRKRRAIPRMQFDPAALRDRRETFEPIDLQIWLAIAGALYNLP